MTANRTLSQNMASDNLILGTWIDTCEYGPEMRYTIGLQGSEIIITAVDTRDTEDEEGDVSNIHWDADKGRLYCCVHWGSTGFLTKCNFYLISSNQMDFTYTNTETILFVRKQPGDNIIPLNIHSMMGIWVNSCEYFADIEYHITLKNDITIVSMIDNYDGEQMEIYDTHWEKEILFLSTYTPSTGRFRKCQFQLLSPNQALLTHTYTETCMLIRERNELKTKKVHTMRYKVVLLIEHPSIDPAIITEQLGLLPFRHQRFGEPRMTPTGTPLAGLWKNSSWSCRLECDGKRAFFKNIDEFVTKLDTHRKFLSNLVLSGGSVYLGISFLGRNNIGDVLSWQSMEKMVKLKIDLGIEVFPDEREH
ncbi:DUF4279 domain-containing protein [Beggiatoa leptomitoformis]|uniref:DUF4279 domain-containing protein n=1 Tax=Beggiatoa leptomitoformis TaxID=288004 RepID=A0A2N9YGG9_9GAMM|nr:DUF4279 domain-containing protein [Beggiatoa leptomitoformis]ALG68206.1 DUF4279 domain-containing protein [Beggiatoa leptomitoformis]AUI69489.1 DUF4279 domain-containing protein [Beggiatoa leptomitoformis]